MRSGPSGNGKFLQHVPAEIRRMLFPRHADVDRIWGTVASSVAKGPLRDAGVDLAKVAPSRAGDEENVSGRGCADLAGQS